ncbi:UNVERIFIED_CONTAM: hypothetical protein GTU68_053913 [Idotea baltica]|nr:hypothetical protein [Idotea baltica]
MQKTTRIYTKTGDKGLTETVDKKRLSKNHPRIIAIGEIDTLNSYIGLLIAEILESNNTVLIDACSVLTQCQHHLFDIGSQLANTRTQAQLNDQTKQLEYFIDHWNAELAQLKNFILPGGSKLIAQAHICRSHTRQTERYCQQLNEIEEKAIDLSYINRLSDLLFVLARLIAKQQNIIETDWIQTKKTNLNFQVSSND